jgi:hypothetical protein
MARLKAGHTAKRNHFWNEDIKNYDRNGPEGQFITDSTTMCNAGSPSYSAVFMISAQSIKVSMKKKRKEESKKWAEAREYIGEGRWSVHVCNLQKIHGAAERPELLSLGVRVADWCAWSSPNMGIASPLVNLLIILFFNLFFNISINGLMAGSPMIKSGHNHHILI